MESQIMTLAKACITVFISLSFCHWIRKHVPAGTKRLLSILPIICLFLFIPLNFSSVHITGTTGFFFAWLANFKLLLFAFDKGPLSFDPSISLPRFVALACLPIKITPQHPPPNHSSHRSKWGTNPSSITHQNGENESLDPSKGYKKSSHFEANPTSITHQNEGKAPLAPSKGSKSSHFETNPSSKTPITKNAQSKKNPSTTILQYAIKTILLAVMVKAYDYSDHIHPKVILGMYCFHIYFMLELILAIVAAIARSMLGLELEPQFNNPILSTSLQDFWGKRWNLMVTSILRPTVYLPIMEAAKGVVGPKWAPLPAVFGTFVVSGMMHEVILYYMGRMGPTFKMMGFFVLHGVCLMVEMVLKKAFATARWRLPRWVSGPLTAGFVAVTCFWLFLPEFIRCGIDVKAFEEYADLGALVQIIGSWIIKN
ncbi:hypothetical protein RIF29_32723 [Crotalaria pallida]|uniref:Wax synthase domain-containing protein n=1 Tax=Crotalaria pallida TaxID=3830 RepID=A0AAN9HXV2_CROPI